GLLHDFGKYSNEFQCYLNSAVGRIDQDADDYVDAASKKGKVDHSTAGAQYVWRSFEKKSALEKSLCQILAICIASHHSGLIDCVSADADKFGESTFVIRMQKADVKTHLDEALGCADRSIIERVDGILARPELMDGLADLIRCVFLKNTDGKVL